MYTDKEQPFDWPFYGEVNEGSEEVSEARTNYRAVLSMIDEHFGKILDFMDEHDMWKDTMLIVNTDHGYMLGEHGFLEKIICLIMTRLSIHHFLSGIQPLAVLEKDVHSFVRQLTLHQRSLTTLESHQHLI